MIKYKQCMRLFSRKVTRKPVCFDLEELTQNKKMLLDKIEQAYGQNGNGIALVRGIPEYEKYRKTLLPMMNEFMKLPDEIIEKYEIEESDFHVGVNRKSKKNPNCNDTKIKFCANPLYDVQKDKNCGTVSKPNVWPEVHMPQLKSAYCNLGKLMHHVGMLLSQKVDHYITLKHPQYTSFISETIKSSQVVAGRLIKYKEDVNTHDWAGWHNDSNLLTCLASPMYFDSKGEEYLLDGDSLSGLQVCSRKKEEILINIPSDCIAFQFGLTSQILSGGEIIATPHKVVCDPVLKLNKISRNQFCVFFFGNMNQVLIPPKGVSREEVTRGHICDKVPNLNDIWKEGETFNEFLDKFYEKFYNPPLGKRKY